MPFLSPVKLGTYTLNDVEHRVEACGFDVRHMSGSVSIFAYDEDGDPLPQDGQVISLADHPDLLKTIAEAVETSVEAYLVAQDSVLSSRGAELACKSCTPRPEGKTISAMADARKAAMAPVEEKVEA